MHRVFVSYHHDNDQKEKEDFVKWAKDNEVFIDWSVDTGEIDDTLPDEEIREIIRDEYLQDCRVTIVLVGTETKNRKHVDWEIYSSMYDGTINKRSGIIVILLPSASSFSYHVAYPNEKQVIYPKQTNWVTIDSKAEYERRYPYVPERIIDNLVAGANISIINWRDVTPEGLRLMIENAYNNADNINYVFPPRRKRNS